MYNLLETKVSAVISILQYNTEYRTISYQENWSNRKIILQTEHVSNNDVIKKTGIRNLKLENL